MIPRFFVSSTYYDLKHVRERLEKFIENYGFQPILFESDKVTYQHGKEIDQSAYFEVGLCHIMTLVIGGRYGSSSSQEKTDEEKKVYDENYISITRKEFETATTKNIPILIFIDKNVYAEFQTYKENQDFFDNPPKDTSGNTKPFKFAHVDHVNIFKFIDLVKSKPIKTFDKVEEIEGYIKSQLSGMFYLYLESLKQTFEDKKILDTISELNNVTLRMNEMLTSVGKQILGEGKEEYESVINSQFEILADFYQEKLYANIEFEREYSAEELRPIDFDKVGRLFYDYVLMIDIPEIGAHLKEKEWNKKYTEVNENMLSEIQSRLYNLSDKLALKKLNIRQLNKEFKRKVLPFIKNENDEDKIIDRLKSTIKSMLEELPF